MIPWDLKLTSAQMGAATWRQPLLIFALLTAELNCDSTSGNVKRMPWLHLYHDKWGSSAQPRGKLAGCKQHPSKSLLMQPDPRQGEYRDGYNKVTPFLLRRPCARAEHPAISTGCWPGLGGHRSSFTSPHEEAGCSWGGSSETALSYHPDI